MVSSGGGVVAGAAGVGGMEGSGPGEPIPVMSSSMVGRSVGRSVKIPENLGKESGEPRQLFKNFQAS